MNTGCFVLIFLTICVRLAYQLKCPKLVTDFSQVTCTENSAKSTKNETFYYDLDLDSCIPKCKKYSDKVYKDCSSDMKCMPGYTCAKRCGPDDTLMNRTCVKDSDCPNQDQNSTIRCGSYCMAENRTESCMAYYINTEDYKNTYWTAKFFKPLCKYDGTWQAKQCKGSKTGRCMCFNSNGTRIFGEAPYQDSMDMTCACSTRKSDLAATNKYPHISFHCNGMGNYEPFQCDQIGQQCWCVDPKTGDLTSPVVPQKAMQFLPCYKNSTVGSQYLRQCDSLKFAQALIEHKLKMHGVQYVSWNFLLCNDDGSYGAYKIEQNIAYCTWRNNTKISPYALKVQSGQHDLNCNCALDFMRYNEKQTCLPSGNYKPLQQHLDKKYCVDQDGFAKTNYFSDAQATDATCSQYY